MTLAQKIKAWIDDFVKNIRKAFEGVSAKSLETKQLEIILGDMTELQKIWDEALEDAFRTSKAKGKIKANQDTPNNTEAKVKTTVVTEAKNNNRRTLSDKHYDELMKNWDANMAEFEKSKSTQNGTQGETDVDNKGTEVYSKRTNYDEYSSLAMKWANEADRKEGDTKVFCKNGRDFRLLEADGNGSFVELVRGNYGKVNELYVEIKKETDTIRKSVRTYVGENEVESGRDSGNNVIYENRRNDVGYNQTTGSKEFSVNASGDDEHNRSGDKGKSVKHSQRDSDGNTLSENQSEYFKDSKVRDEKGNLLVMYHGTPHDFTVFKNRGSGMYFTADPEYAYGYTQLSGKVMKVYLNITKPFDILKDGEARKIFVDEFIRGGYAQGIHPSSSMSVINKYIENGVDWVEGDNLIEFLEENEYDYDGLVLNEGSDSVADSTGNKAVWRGFSYVTFKSNQSKKVDNLNPTSDPDIRYSRRSDGMDLEKTAIEYFGRTFSWKETGYILTNGSKLDFSGKHNGARGGYRTVDHREIIDSFPKELQNELDGNEAMVEFMQRGNIRIMPEGNGINLSVLPTKAQEEALSDYISRVRGEVTLDIDDEYGDTVVSVDYPKGTRYDRILRDIRQYFKDGTEPVISDVSRFRYSRRGSQEDFLSTENRVQPNSASSINWVYKAEIFSVSENKLFHEKISQINQGSDAFEQNFDGEYMLPINNKIIFTDGDYDAPYISRIIEVMTNSGTKFEDVKERIFNVEKGKSQNQDAARVFENFYGDGFILTYRSGTVGVYAWENGKRKGRTRSQVIRNYQRLQNRRGNDTEGSRAESVTDGILFSRRSTQSDGRYLAKELKREYMSNLKITASLNNLKIKYEKMKNDSDPNYRLEYDEAISNVVPPICIIPEKDCNYTLECC